MMCRHVPLSLIIHQFLGGHVVPTGWVFLGFGLLLQWVMIDHTDPLGDLAFWTQRAERTTAEIVDCRKTRYRPGKVPLYRYDYVFIVDERLVEGRSFRKGHAHEVGASVPIDYLPSDPDRSRLVDGQLAPFPGILAVFSIFALVGAVIVLAGLLRGIRNVRLLRVGVPARGRYLGRSQTPSKINDKPVYRLRYAFVDESGFEHQATADTHLVDEVDVGFGPTILYGSRAPDRAVVLAHLPGKAGLDDTGALTVSGGAMSVAMVPLITVVGLVAYSLLG